MRQPLPMIPILVIAAIGVPAALILPGVLSGDDTADAISKREFIRVVNERCERTREQASVRSTSDFRRLSDAQRAENYLTWLAAFRQLVEDVAPPPAEDRATLTRFRDGLASATNLTNTVAQAPPSARRERSQLAAHLVIASGQVEAAGLEYGFSPRCEAVWDLIVGSAEVAERPPRPGR
jgi:hypothetical protein